MRLSENLLDVIRMIQKDAVLKGDGHTDDIAVLACDPAGRAERVQIDLRFCYRGK